MLVGLATSIAAPGFAQENDGGQLDWLSQARIVAEMEGIPLGEAVRRGKLQARLAREAERLSDDIDYAGSWIERDSRSFRMKHAFKGTAKKLETGDAGFDKASDTVEARYSLREIRVGQDALVGALAAAGFAVGTTLDIKVNQLIVRSSNVAEIRALIASGAVSLPPFAVLSDKVRTYGIEAAISGGGALTGNSGVCTAGLNVRSGSVAGVSTAGHCVPYNISTHRGTPVGSVQPGSSTAIGSDLA